MRMEFTAMIKKRPFCIALLCMAFLGGCDENHVTDPVISENITTPAITVETTQEIPIAGPTEEPTEPPLITVQTLPENYQIDVEPVLQLPELPAGCEITSLTCLLNYLGFSADKEVMADTYLDYVLEGATHYTLFDKYIGDPRADGYGCYSPVIVKAATEYLADQNSSMKAVNLSGSTQEEILLAVASGHPIVIWNTVDSMDVSEELAWRTPDGEEVYWCIWEHCLLLTGYDLKKNTVTVCDSLKGVAEYNLTQFFAVYNDLYQQAMTIY